MLSFFSPRELELVSFADTTTNKLDKKMLNNQLKVNIIHVVNECYHDEETAHRNIREISSIISQDLDDININRDRNIFQKLISCF